MGVVKGRGGGSEGRIMVWVGKKGMVSEWEGRMGWEGVNGRGCNGEKGG